MTPKEKAKELIDKIYDVIDIQDGNLWQSTKQCALISVEQIIDEYQSISDLESTLVVNGQVMSIVDKIIYWEEVEREIIKL